jgi:hypothetical protein
MTLFRSSRLLISLPAAEIAALDLPGSLMTAEQVLVLPVSRTLACALALVQSICHTRGIETRYLARPEIFTHGVPAAWLSKRLAGFTEHLCITDASTVKHVDFCRTHMFLYRLAQQDSYLSFARLCRRAPELLAQVQSQVNTCFAWGEASQRTQPSPVYLHAVSLPPAPAPPLLYPFVFRPYQFEETAQRILAATPLAISQRPAGAQTVYLPLTETALHDPAFARAAAHRIREAFQHSDTLLLLRLPNDQPGETLASRIGVALKALATSGVVLPRSTPGNIFFVSTDLAAAPDPGNTALILHDGFDFWRHDRAFYENAAQIEVLASADSQDEPTFLPLDVTEIFGPRARRVWLEPPRGDDRR